MKHRHSRTKYVIVSFSYMKPFFISPTNWVIPPWMDYEECKGRVHSRGAQVPSIDCGIPLSLVLL